MQDVAFRVGVDARPLHEPPCGIRRYLQNLLRALLKLDNATGYVLFTNRPLPELSANNEERVQISTLGGSRQALMRPWWEVLTLPRAIRKSSVDLFFSPMGIVPARCLVPSVVTVHDLAFMKYSGIQPWNYRMYWNWVMKRVPNADAIIAVSHSTKSDIEQLLPVQPERVHVIWEGLDESFRSPTTHEERQSLRIKYGLKGDFVLFVGTREPRKNLNTLVKAMSVLNETRTDPVPLILVGPEGWGNQGDPQESGTWVRVLQPLSDGELKTLYSCATVFAFPSLYEGFGLPLLEAMSCGAAVIASNVASIPELAGDSALLVNPTDVAEWTRGLALLLKDGQLRSSLVQKGHSQVERFA
ncbi:MAG TPA: glycosyltransferase family 1 protein, partial [bacterium]|nr:glycosyltransferase family 1 protein [bacterium]